MLRLSRTSVSAGSPPPSAADSRARRSGSTAGATKRTACGSSTPTTVPWCRPASSSGMDSACAAPRPFHIAMAPSVAPIIMCQRAPALRSATASGKWRARRAMPSSATASAGGLMAGERNASRQWLSASIPVPAASQAGMLAVRSGSQIATFGMRWTLMNTALAPPSASVMPNPRPIFAACAGRGGDADHGCDSRRHRTRTASAIIGKRAGMRRHQRHGLGRIDHRATADGDDRRRSPRRDRRARAARTQASVGLAGTASNVAAIRSAGQQRLERGIASTPARINPASVITSGRATPSIASSAPNSVRAP